MEDLEKNKNKTPIEEGAKENVKKTDDSVKNAEQDMTRKEEAIALVESSSAQKSLKVLIVVDDAKTKNRINILLNHLYGEGDAKKKLAEYLKACVDRDFEKIRNEL